MNALKCPRCERAIAAEELNLKSGRGRCGFCKTTFHFHYQETPEPLLKHIPEGFKIERGVAQTQISIAWFNARIYAMLILAALIGLVVYVYWGSTDSTILKVMMGAAVGFALYTLYYALAIALNSTRLMATPEQLTVKVAPIPWSGTIDLQASEIKRIGREQTQTEGTPSRIAYSHVVFAELINNQQRVLIDGLNKQGAQLIEEEIMHAMNRG